MVGEPGADLLDGSGQFDAVVSDLGGRDQNIAVEVGKHPFGACLGTIDTDDAEVLRTDFLDPSMHDAIGLLRELSGARLGLVTGTFECHETVS